MGVSSPRRVWWPSARRSAHAVRRVASRAGSLPDDACVHVAVRGAGCRREAARDAGRSHAWLCSWRVDVLGVGDMPGPRRCCECVRHAGTVHALACDDAVGPLAGIQHVCGVCPGAVPVSRHGGCGRGLVSKGAPARPCDVLQAGQGRSLMLACVAVRVCEPSVTLAAPRAPAYVTFALRVAASAAWPHGHCRRAARGEPGVALGHGTHV